jgi:hypothetical protein
VQLVPVELGGGVPVEAGADVVGELPPVDVPSESQTLVCGSRCSLFETV